MASETQGVADFTQAVREAAEKLLGPHSIVEMREWSGWETPLPSRFVFHLLGERVPDSIRESADDDQQLICGWLRAAQERARLGRRATPPWMALSSAPAELHRYLRTIGAEHACAHHDALTSPQVLAHDRCREARRARPRCERARAAERGISPTARGAHGRC